MFFSLCDVPVLLWNASTTVNAALKLNYSFQKSNNAWESIPVWLVLILFPFTGHSPISLSAFL